MQTSRAERPAIASAPQAHVAPFIIGGHAYAYRYVSSCGKMYTHTHARARAALLRRGVCVRVALTQIHLKCAVVVVVTGAVLSYMRALPYAIIDF